MLRKHLNGVWKIWLVHTWTLIQKTGVACEIYLHWFDPCLLNEAGSLSACGFVMCMKIWFITFLRRQITFMHVSHCIFLVKISRQRVHGLSCSVVVSSSHSCLYALSQTTSGPGASRFVQCKIHPGTAMYLLMLEHCSSNISLLVFTPDINMCALNS